MMIEEAKPDNKVDVNLNLHPIDSLSISSMMTAFQELQLSNFNIIQQDHDQTSETQSSNSFCAMQISNEHNTTFTSTTFPAEHSDNHSALNDAKAWPDCQQLNRIHHDNIDCIQHTTIHIVDEESLMTNEASIHFHNTGRHYQSAMNPTNISSTELHSESPTWSYLCQKIELKQSNSYDDYINIT